MTENAIANVETLGPAMSALNPRQRQFVIEFLEAPTDNYARAATRAGYGGANPNSVKTIGHRLAHDPRILAAIHEEAIRRINSAQGLAVTRLVDLMESTTDEKVKLKAIGMILNRTGLHEMTEHKVTTKDESKTDEALVERIKEVAKQLGLDQKSLLGNRAEKPAAALPAIDAEFVEVGSLEGLEDVI